jgi:hypothetical protein
MNQMNQYRRESVNKPLSEIIGNDNEDTKEFFNDSFRGEEERGTGLYRVSEGQRYSKWTPQMKERLVDSVMTGFPIHALVISKQHNQEFFCIQDGQSRLNALQEFVMDKYTWSDKKFSELTGREQRVFLSYQVQCQIIHNPSKEQEADIFERLNSGKPLSDSDKFHNRSQTPVMLFINELKTSSCLRDNISKFMGAIGEGKSRERLSDFTGAVLAIAYKSVHCISTSYFKNQQYLKTDLTDAQKADVYAALTLYFETIASSLQNKVSRPKKIYGKLSGMLGLFLYWRIMSPADANVDVWKWYCCKMQEKSFGKHIFKSLSAGADRNLVEDSIRQRVEVVMREFGKWENAASDLEQNQEEACDSDNDTCNGSDDVSVSE